METKTVEMNDTVVADLTAKDYYFDSYAHFGKQLT